MKQQRQRKGQYFHLSCVTELGKGRLTSPIFLKCQSVEQFPRYVKKSRFSCEQKCDVEYILQRAAD